MTIKQLESGILKRPVDERGTRTRGTTEGRILIVAQTQVQGEAAAKANLVLGVNGPQIRTRLTVEVRKVGLFVVVHLVLPEIVAILRSDDKRLVVNELLG